MGKVYQCDRCGAIGKIGAVGDERFTDIKYGPFDGLLCSHCMKKLEEFLSDPNCMESTEKEEEDNRELLTPDKRAEVMNAINDAIIDKFDLVACGYEDDGVFFNVTITNRH